MDESEALARQYLETLSLGDVIYEPDGNVPPDFLVDGRIAVEVRRLNQHRKTSDGGVEPLEKLAMPFPRNVERYLPTLGPATNNEAWFVILLFSRPLESWNNVKKRLQETLAAFVQRSDRDQKRYTFTVTTNLEIDLIRANNPQPNRFQLGGYSDDDSGGMVLFETTESLLVCVPEKEAKVAPYRHLYPEWWLVLVNHVALRLNPDDLHELRQQQPVSHTWDKIILVNPLQPTQGVEI